MGRTRRYGTLRFSWNVAVPIMATTMTAVPLSFSTRFSVPILQMNRDSFYNLSQAHLSCPLGVSYLFLDQWNFHKVNAIKLGGQWSVLYIEVLQVKV